MLRRGDADDVRPGAKVLRKILITLLIGGAAYYFTDLSGQDPIWALSASIFIGGVTLVVQFLHDFEKRLGSVEDRQTAHSEAMRTLIEDGFAKSNEATELFQAVEASALQTDAVTQLVRHSTQIAPDSPPLYYGFAQLEINRTSRFLKELGEGGEVSYDGEDRDWILALTMKSCHTIDAISLSTVDAGGEGYDGGLWTSDLGHRYLELQKAAALRKVGIRRVFVIDRHGQTGDPDLQRICQQQKDLGVQVKVLDRSAIPDGLQRRLFDFVVFDGVISYEVTPASRVGDNMRPTIVNTHLVLQPERVKERLGRFDDLWAAAQELS